MIILALRTDKLESEIKLYNDETCLGQITWEAHRALAETLHLKIQALLKEQGKVWSDIAGIVAYRGPGSFTGLRIGLSVGNALAYANNVPIVGTTGDAWVQEGIAALATHKGQKQITPEYGSDAHITAPHK